MRSNEGVRTQQDDGFSRVLVDALVHGLRVGFYIVDGTGKITMVNPYAEQLLERPARELIGADAHDLLHRNADGSPIPRDECPHLAAIRRRVNARSEETWFTRGAGGLVPLGLMVTPVQLGGDDLGGVVLFYDLWRHKALAEEQAAHLAAMEKLTDRLALVAESSAVLASTLEVDEALRRLSRLMVPRLADWALIDLLGPDGELRRVAVGVRDGQHRSVTERWEGPLPRLTEDLCSPLARVLRGGPSVLMTSEELAALREPAICPDERRVYDLMGAGSVIIAPLRTPRRVVGAVTLGRRPSSPGYDSTDLSLIDDLAGRAGLAVDNAHLFEEQRRIAETMQRHLLTPLPGVEHLEMAARYQPAPHGSQVGGDWYDAFPLPGGRTTLVIGDVMGHDLQAAAEMSQIRNMLRMMAWAQKTPTGRIVDRLDDALPHIAGGLLATLVLAQVEGAPGGPWTLHWTSAGHPPPLLVGDDGSARYLEQGQGLMLGTGIATRRPDAHVALPPDSTLLLYTDGLIETAEYPLEAGLDQLGKHAAALAGRPLPYFCDEILSRMRHDVVDDIALLALRVASG